MQLTTFILPILSLAAVLQAAPVVEGENALAPRTSSSGPTFTVTEFFIHSYFNNANSDLFFKVKSNPFGNTATCRVFGKLTGSTFVPDVKYWTKCYNEIGFGFQWDAKIKSYLLTVTQKTGGNILSGSISMEQKIKTTINSKDKNQSYKYLDHPAKFTISANLL
ncbi:hypothetical protein ABW20_dc0106060 [Dactylellina cionopaga]|nr:hypothetical protein ABW20_dc0106060 [Dactylellina cionopaga]